MIATLGLLGDLTVSLFKRDAGVKVRGGGGGGGLSVTVGRFVSVGDLSVFLRSVPGVRLWWFCSARRRLRMLTLDNKLE
jgi:hypothetical protein